jgi:hypothetical protein
VRVQTCLQAEMGKEHEGEVAIVYEVIIVVSLIEVYISLYI